MPGPVAMAFDLVPSVESLDPHELRPLDGKPAAAAFLGAGRLWAATAGGVTALTAPGDEPSQPTLAGGHLFFANVNLRTLGALAPDGYLLHCEGEGRECAGFDAFSGRVFADRLASVGPRPELEALTRAMAAASRPPREQQDLALPDLGLALVIAPEGVEGGDEAALAARGP